MDLFEVFSKSEIMMVLYGYSRQKMPHDLYLLMLDYVYPYNLTINSNKTFKCNIIYEFNNLILNKNSILTTTEYDDKIKKGGILLLKIKENIVLNDDSCLNLNGLGYKGGNAQKQGHSYKGFKETTQSTSNNYGGGGASMWAAGAGYGTEGQSCFGALGGECYGNSKLDILHLGSGGGGSDYCNGGNGGGSIKIECNKLIINENCGIYCNGNNGNNYSGSGSGGSIHIICNELINYGNIHSKGGSGYGGHGGFGRIRIDCNKIKKKGSISPNIGYNIFFVID